MGIVLAGVSGAGKTTIARALAERLGYRYVPVDTAECVSIPYPLARQLCFARVVHAYTASACSRCVLDNSLLSVLAYSRALLDDSPAAHQLTLLLKKLAWLEASHHRVVVLYVDDPAVLSQRLEKKGDRLGLGVHLKAQEALADIARHWSIPMLNTNTAIMETLERLVRVGV